MIKEERLRIKSLSKSLQTLSKRRTGRQLITINHIMGLVGTLCLAQLSPSPAGQRKIFSFSSFFSFLILFQVAMAMSQLSRQPEWVLVTH